MDAKISKSRLSNYLAYDWLKILIAVALAVTAVCVFFTTIKTRVRDEQVFTVYAYTDMKMGADGEILGNTLLKSGVLSYEILKTDVEQLADTASGSLFGGLYGGALYATRITESSRTVMFTSAVDEIDSAGYEAVEMLLGVNAYSEGADPHGFLNFETYLNDCKAYLQQFFGDDVAAGALDTQKAEEEFLARNGEDRRFTSDKKRAEGLLRERERLEKLRKDYVAVEKAFESGLLSYEYITIDEAHADSAHGVEQGEYNCGVKLGNLPELRKLFYYEEVRENETMRASNKTSLILFNTAALANRQNALRYETVAFLSYLIANYGA